MPIVTASAAAAAARADVRDKARGFVTTNYPNEAVASNLTLTSGTAQFALVGLNIGDVVTKLCFQMFTAGATLTYGRAGLYDATGVLLASTADQSAALTGAAGILALPLSAAYTVTAAGGYYLGILATTSVGTMPHLAIAFTGSTEVSVDVAPGFSLYQSQAGLAALPTPSATFVLSAQSIWVGVA